MAEVKSRISYADKDTERVVKDNLTQIEGLLIFMDLACQSGDTIEAPALEAMVSAIRTPFLEIANLANPFNEED